MLATVMRPVLLLAAVLSLAACANPGKGYADRHPELTPAQRRIFNTARIPSGDDVAGLTREQIKIAMGGDPTTYDKADGGDVWIYSRRKSQARDLEAPLREPNSSIDPTRSFTDTAAFDAHGDVLEKTSVFFSGDRATHARVTEEKE